MAITKIFAIRKRLDKSVSYAVNEKKTGLRGMIEYAINRNKTEQRLFETAINCENPQTAYTEMQDTKKRWNKSDGVLGYHLIQSFAPGETTPAQAHQIGVEFARQLFGDRYEVVIGTHLDKDHLHNHIVINSVSFIDGLKYHSSPLSYYNNVRTTSDDLCQHNDLTVITPKGRGKHYAEWQAEKKQQPTIRGAIRNDIDRAIERSFTYQDFIKTLNKTGYNIKTNTKYLSVCPPGGKRYIRLKSLGEDYTEEHIKKRIIEQRQQSYIPPVRKAKKSFHSSRRQPRKLHGFQSLYFKYLYLLGHIPKPRPHRKAVFLLHSDLVQFNRYQRQFVFLHENGIETADQLNDFSKHLEIAIEVITSSRKSLYQERRKILHDEDDPDTTALQEQISTLTAELRVARKSLYLCQQIKSDSDRISACLNQLKSEKTNRKEEKHHEYSR